MFSRAALLGGVCLAAAACAVEEAETPVGPIAAEVVVPGCGAPTVGNGGFESGLQTWRRIGSVAAPAVAARTGTKGARVGRPVPAAGTSSLWRRITIPAASSGPSTLAFWMQPRCRQPSDHLRVELRSKNGAALLASAVDECTNSTQWSRRALDVSPWAGQTVSIWFSVDEDGATPGSYLYVDDAAVETDVPGPQVAIASPVEHSTTQGAVPVAINATANGCTSLDTILLSVDGAPVGSASSSPATIVWDSGAAAPGGHILTATATDALGQSTATSITVWVPEPCGGTPTWSHIAGTGTATSAAAMHLPPEHFPLDRIDAWGRNNQLLLYDDRDEALLASPTLSGTLIGPPLLALLPADPDPYAYATTGGPSNGGWIYKLRAEDGDILASRRLVSNGCASDELAAGPLVIPFSRPDLPLVTRVVIAAQKLGCGEHERNSVFALDAVTLATVWRFNVGELEVDGIEESCSYEPSRDLLACASAQQPGGGRPSLWLLRGADGSLVGAADVGNVLTRPVFHPTGSHVYVLAADGRLLALDVDDPVQPGSLDWWVGLGDGAARGGLAVGTGAAADLVFAVDPAGGLHAVYDGGDQPGAGLLIWSLSLPGARRFDSAPTFDGVGRLFAGTADGTIEQVAFASGALEPSRRIDFGGTFPVATPTLDQDGGVVGVSPSGATRRYCRPFPVP